MRRRRTKRNMNAAVHMQKEGGSDSTFVVLDDVIPDIPDSTLVFDVGPGIRLAFDVISNNIAVVDEVISEKWHFNLGNLVFFFVRQKQ